MSSTIGRAAFGFGAAIAPALIPGIGGVLIGGAFAIAGSVLFRPKGIDAAEPNVQIPVGQPGRKVPRVFGTDVPQDVGVDFFTNIRKKEQTESTKGSQEVTTGFKVLVDLGCSVCQGPGEILQLWREGDLVYDVESGGALKALTGTIRLYPGSLTQEPDPAEQTAFGIEKTPAYLGIVRFVIEDHDISDINRMPIFKAKVSRTATDNYLKDEIDGDPVYFHTGAFTWDKSKYISTDENLRVQVLDMDSQTVEIRQDMGENTTRGSTGGWTASDDAYFWIYDPGVFGQEVHRLAPPSYDTALSRAGPDGSSQHEVKVSAPFLALIQGEASQYQEIIFALNSDKVRVWRRSDFEVGGAILSDIDDMESFTGASNALIPGTFGIDGATGDVWFFGMLQSTTTCYAVRFDITAQAWAEGAATHPLGAISFSYTGPSVTGKMAACYLAATSEIVVMGNNGVALFFDPDTMTKVEEWSLGYSLEPLQFSGLWRAGPDADGKIFVQEETSTQRTFHELDLVNRTQINTYDMSNWGLPNPGVSGDDYAAIYDERRRALVISSFTQDKIYGIYLDRKTGAGTNLEEITEELIDDTYLDSVLDFDGSDVTAVTVRGATYRDDVAINFVKSLYDFHQCRLIDSDWKLKGFQRDNASGGTIADIYLGAAENDGAAPKILRPQAHPLTLPQRREIAYRRDGDYENATQGHSRSPDAVVSRDPTREVYPGVLTDDEAKTGVMRMLNNDYLEAVGYEVSLPPKFMTLEPGDVRTLEDGSESPDIEIVEHTMGANGVIEVKAVRIDDTALSVTGTGGPSIIVTPTIDITSPSTPVIFDTPLLLETLEGASPVIGSNVRQTTPGTPRTALIQRATSASGPWTDYTVIDGDAVIQSGVLRTALPEGPTTVFDRTNTISVILDRGSLSSAASEDAVLGDETINPYAIESDDGPFQLGQFVNATLEADGSYTLDTLLRGRKDTDNYLASGVGRKFYALDVDNMVIKNIPLSEVGQTFYFRAFTLGSNTAGPIVSYTFAGRSKMPYSGTDANGTLDGNNDWQIDWMARSRFSASQNMEAPPIGENASGGSGGLDFSVDMLDAAEGSPVASATITTTASANGSVVTVDTTDARRQTMVIDEADQIAWFGSAQATIHLAIYQLSADVGRGFPLYVSFSGTVTT